MLPIYLTAYTGYIVLGAIWFTYAIWMASFVRRQLGPGLKYLHKEDPSLGEKYDCFRRKDIGKWNKFEIYFCALFFFPLKVMIFFVGSLMGSITLGFFTMCHNPSKGYSCLRRTLIKTSAYFWSRIALYGLGFLWIKRVNLNISDYDPSYPRDAAQTHNNQKAPIVVSNHVSFIDIFLYMCCREVPSFLAKAEIKKYPIFGSGATALGTIFLQRDSKDKRDDVTTQIEKRIEDFGNSPGTTPPVLIFPEGTTSNGEYILSFKKGAFVNRTPLRLYAIKYTNKNFSPAFDTLGIGKLFLFTLLQFKNSVTVYDLGTYYPDYLNLKGEEDWQEYATRIKHIYVKALGLKATDMGFQDMITYQKNLTKDIEM